MGQSVFYKLTNSLEDYLSTDDVYATAYEHEIGYVTEGPGISENAVSFHDWEAIRDSHCLRKCHGDYHNGNVDDWDDSLDQYIPGCKTFGTVCGMGMVDGKWKQLFQLPSLFCRAEKIEGIRINNITGFNKSNGVEGGRISQDSSVNKVVDSVLDLALQLPAVKKIGEEVGLNISDGLKGISAALEPDDQIKKDKKESK